MHRAAGEHAAAREYLEAAIAPEDSKHVRKWIVSSACIELAVVDLEELSAKVTKELSVEPVEWTTALNSASARLDQALKHNPSGMIEWRVTMVREDHFV
jgi:hypothetical protein